MINPETGTILVYSNGQHIPPHKSYGRVLGSSLSGTGALMKTGSIAAGLRLSLFVAGIGEVMLSPTSEVRVNGTKVLPVEITDWEEVIEGLEFIDSLPKD